MKILLVIVLFSINLAAFAQMSDFSSSTTGKHGTMTVRKTYSEVYKVVEQMPVFPGGNIALVQYFARIPYPKQGKMKLPERFTSSMLSIRQAILPNP